MEGQHCLATLAAHACVSTTAWVLVCRQLSCVCAEVSHTVNAQRSVLQNSQNRISPAPSSALLTNADEHITTITCYLAAAAAVNAMQDADSLDTATGKKSEGAFYVWTAYEIKSVLGADRAGVFGDVYGVQAGGNCNLSARSDPHQEFTGKNVLMQVRKLVYKSVTLSS